MKRQEGELGKCHARDYSGNAGNVQLGALRVGLFGLVLGFCCAGGLVEVALRWYSGWRLRGAGGFVWCFGLCAGIRGLPSCFKRRRLVFWPLRWRPRYVFVLHALPLCGAAPTFLCRRKEK
ncbi:hypothetical protein [Paraburkholderia hospita]|uniref:hypothetical protein n=1 Tax=Paraburkholderia TaxID=1822464 RepID=UPI00117850FE|nr:hypothetical protein [Paraburkholderia hospita]